MVSPQFGENVTTKVPLYALRIKTAAGMRRSFRCGVSPVTLLDKDTNTCDNDSGVLLMELFKRIYRILLALVALWCGGMLLAPLLTSTLPGVSAFLYSFYSPVCHQIDGRSFHLFGEKAGVCSRCFAIYWGFLVSLLAYPFLRQLHSAALPHRGWIALAILPMALDVCLNFAGFHQSTLVTRGITGLLFGLTMPFYLLPPLLEGIAQLRDQYIARGGFFYARKTQ
jgi:uncharacterized membrane protein